MSRSVTLYRLDRRKNEVEKFDVPAGYISKAESSDGVATRREKVNFHKNILEGCKQAEADGCLGNITRRQADFHKRVHTAAAECGGDLPPIGTTRLGF
jgi:hypothetical protein